MAINIVNEKIRSNNIDLDANYGPYSSIQEAHNALLDNGKNKVGVTVGINDNNTLTIEEYWYQGGTDQLNLVKKQTASVEVDSELSSTSENPVQNKVVKSALDAKGTYSKPSGGIPKTDLASGVQTSLDKADTALQQHQDISGKQDKSNIRTSFQTTPDDNHYPSEKLVKDSLDLKAPSTNIAKSALASDVQTSLGKADSAIQGVQVNGSDLTPDANKKVNILPMTGATSSSAGSAGLVPAPTAGDDEKILQGDGTWVTKPTNGKSAYDIWYEENEYSDPTTYNEEYFLATLKANIGAFKFVGTVAAVQTQFENDGIGSVYTSSIDGVTADASTLSVILLMTTSGLSPEKTYMIATQDDGSSGYEFVYAGDLQSAMPSNVLTESNIVNDLTTGGTNDVLSAEAGRQTYLESLKSNKFLQLNIESGNLINPDNFQPHKAINSQGEIVYNQYEFIGVTDFIPVNGRDIWANCYQNPSNYAGYVVYDENFNKVRYEFNTRIYEYQSGEYYIRFMFNSFSGSPATYDVTLLRANYGTTDNGYTPYAPIESHIKNSKYLNDFKKGITTDYKGDTIIPLSSIIPNSDCSNLVNPVTLLTNSVLKKNGDIDTDQTYENYVVTDFIPVNGKNVYAPNPILLNNYASFSVYDSNFNLIRNIINNNQYTYVENQDETYVRICIIYQGVESRLRANYGTESNDPGYTPYSPIDPYLKKSRYLSQIKSVDYLLTGSSRDFDSGTVYLNFLEGYSLLPKGLAIKIQADSENTVDVCLQGVYNIESNPSNPPYTNLAITPPGQERVVILDKDYEKLRTYALAHNTKFTIIVVGMYDVLSKLTSNPLYNKHLVTIGDSYCKSGDWQSELVNLRGCVFDAEKNKNRYSMTGTKTLQMSGGGQERARKMADDVNDGILNAPNLIIVENVNDSGFYTPKVNGVETPNLERIGTQDDIPYMMGAGITVVTPQSTLSNASEAEQYFIDNISSILSGVSYEHGYRVRIPYNYSGSKAIRLTISQSPTTDGYFTIQSIGQGTPFRFDVTANESISDIIDQITEFYWPGHELEVDKSNGTILFVPIDESKDLNFDFTHTDAVMSYEKNLSGVGTLNLEKTYNLHNGTGWSNSDNWVKLTEITMWSAYKGLFNFLSEKFPAADIYLMMPIAYNCNFDTAVNGDGTPDTDLIRDTICYPVLKQYQKEIANYCLVRFLDLEQYAGIYPQNASTYFPSNNYHPNTDGYKKWGYAVSKMI